MLKWWRRKREMIDPESSRLWDSFRKSEACWACRNIEEFHRKQGMAMLFLQEEGGDLVLVSVRHCPACGRRLVFHR